MRPRYCFAALLLGAFFGGLVATTDLAAQNDQHEHEGEFYICGSDWARQIDNDEVNETTRLNNPDVYERMVAKSKERQHDRAVLSGTSAVDEYVDDFFLVNRSTGARETVVAVSKYVGPPWVMVWVDVRDTSRVRQATIDRLVEGLVHKVKPGPNTRDENKGVIENDIAIFGEPPTDQWSSGDVKVHLLLLDIDNGTLTGGTLSGYFSPLDQTTQLGSNEMNVLYIDAPLLYGSNPSTGNIENVLGTVAHEFQHLINHRHYTDDQNVETHYLYNEGLSEVASLRNGYSDRSPTQFLGKPNRFAFFDAPYGANSGDTILPAYERGMLMTHYLSEQYGDEFLNRLVAAPGSQIEPIRWALQQRQIGHDVRDVWTNFWVANYLQGRDNPHGDSRWKYRTTLGGTAASVAKGMPTSGPRTDDTTIRGYSAFLQRYGNDNIEGKGMRVRFHPNSREYRAHVVLFQDNTIVDVRPLAIDQDHFLEDFTTAVLIINSLDGGDQVYEWTVEPTTLGVEDYHNKAGVLAVTGAVPNPARDEVRFNFRTAQAEDVTLELFDIRGEMVARPLNAERYEGGQHSIAIDVAALSPGVYTARLQDGSGAVAVRQIVVVK